jgi:hypothetical protein
MQHRVFQLVLVLSIGALALGAGPQAPDPSFVVHEWGTFTSIAGADGQAVVWLPQTGATDLPCFVERSPVNIKAEIPGTVRMETPVLYFYSPQPITTSVHVDFPRGAITEWYPHASVTPTQLYTAAGGAIAWPDVHVVPRARETWPRESGDSHYYAARHTAADPVRVGSQTEKFLFYRGIGQFQPPLSAVAREDGSVAVRTLHEIPAGDVILFENRGGAMTFTAHHLTSSATVLPRASLDDASAPPLAELKRILIANGLYQPEAEAMVETWKDSWFEEGARLLYIVPRADVDQILPLTISPQPSTVARVFVGRIELMTPETLRAVRAAITSGDRAVMARYGRFLEPIAERLSLAAKIPPSLLTYRPAASCR